LVASAPVVTVATTTTSTAPLQTMTVVKGDTIASIAAKYGVTADALAQVNGITDQSHILVGQVLKIPPAGATGTTTTTKAAK
jgi:LysM repeat protein